MSHGHCDDGSSSSRSKHCQQTQQADWRQRLTTLADSSGTEGDEDRSDHEDDECESLAGPKLSFTVRRQAEKPLVPHRRLTLYSD